MHSIVTSDTYNDLLSDFHIIILLQYFQPLFFELQYFFPSNFIGDRIKLYKCSFCNATYTTNSHLKYHMFKHTGDFPFTCTFCNKGFAGKSQLKYHELRHTGIVSCFLCIHFLSNYSFEDINLEISKPLSFLTNALVFFDVVAHRISICLQNLLIIYMSTLVNMFRLVI